MTKKEIENHAKPNPPKKPMSAFFLYKDEVLKSVQQQNPNLKFTDLTKLIGEKWQKESEESKKKYQQSYEAAKKIYDAQFKDYVEKHGKPERVKKIKRLARDKSKSQKIAKGRVNKGKESKGKKLEKKQKKEKKEKKPKNVPKGDEKENNGTQNQNPIQIQTVLPVQVGMTQATPNTDVKTV